jgi:aconitate hydratase
MKNYNYTDISNIDKKLNNLPYCLKILLENVLRKSETKDEKNLGIKHFLDFVNNEGRPSGEINFYPARVLMQDFTGVPAVVDLASMRSALKNIGGNPSLINPIIPVDLVIDHSVQVNNYGTKDSLKENMKIEYEQNIERYKLLKWAQKAYSNFRVVPPGKGICHQVNLEYLANLVFKSKNGEIYPDTVVGTDSHTTMVNGLSVLGWGVGGIEAEAAMLGRGISMLIPEVIGVRFFGKIKEDVFATDIVLTVTEILRKKGVVNKFVEFFGAGLKNLSLSDRATIANMAPEYGATVGFFPIDNETINYLRLTGRDESDISLIEEYSKKQGLWYEENVEKIYTDIIEIDLSKIQTSLAGPKRPQDKLLIGDVKSNFAKELNNINNSSKNNNKDNNKDNSKENNNDLAKKCIVKNTDYSLSHGSVVIAAITSCTNTSNPTVMVAAGITAKKIVERGLKIKPWVKTSLAPGSQVVTEYLRAGGLDKCLDEIGFNVVGYGCTTCIGNSGPLKSEIESTILENSLVVASVLSGNRNFEGRIHGLVKANYLASPPIVIAYALCGNVNIDLSSEVIAFDKDKKPVMLKDILPTKEEVDEYIDKYLNSSIFKAKYNDIFLGDEMWQDVSVTESETYSFDPKSTYIADPKYFENIKKGARISDIKNAKILAIFGDSITTDHISPAGNINKNSVAAKYLNEKGVESKDFNSYGARRGHHEVMTRGTFANVRIKNLMCKGVEGGFTIYQKQQLSIFDAAMKYKNADVPMVVLAGKEYGTGSSRDWAAKGTYFLGIKAVIAESFERIHRSNLVGMGILPIVVNGLDRDKLTGYEGVNIVGISDSELKPKMKLKIRIGNDEIDGILQVFTKEEIDYINSGGILREVFRSYV